MINNGYNAYKNALEAVDKVEVKHIIALYEGSINFMNQAIDAIEHRDYEKRFNVIEKICAIIGGLRQCLDHEKGGMVAKALDDYYAAMDFDLIRIQTNDSIEDCKRVRGNLERLLGAWQYVEQEVMTAELEAKSSSPAFSDALSPKALTEESTLNV